MLSLRHLITNFLDEMNQTKGKHIMIIIHMQRFSINENEIEFETLFQDWNTNMFDLLNEEFLLPIDCIHDKSFLKLSEIKNFLEFEDIFYSLVDFAL